MSRRRFFAPRNAFAHDNTMVRLEAEEARHLRDVLRLQLDDEVYVFDGEGHEFQCSISELRRDFAELTVVAEVEPASPESPLNLTLGIALLKGEKFDLVVQKLTELGVSTIVPLITERADIRLHNVKDAEKRVMRWQRIAHEAAKQSGRARVPEITEPRSFESFVRSGSESLRLMFSESQGQSLKPAFAGEHSDVIAMVGSEGGWTDKELTTASDAGWKIVTLSGRILRAETAAIAVTALLQNQLGDLN